MNNLFLVLFGIGKPVQTCVSEVQAVQSQGHEQAAASDVDTFVSVHDSVIPNRY